MHGKHLQACFIFVGEGKSLHESLGGAPLKKTPAFYSNNREGWLVGKQSRLFLQIDGEKKVLQH